MTKYTACICEGGAETAILDLLLDQNKLIFSRNDLLEGEILKTRKGMDFETRYLKKDFSGKITVYRILDSRRENFKISKAYQHKVEVVNVITAPEIEMLIICNEGKYQDFEKKKGMSPSEYCKSILKMKNVKSVSFVKAYFSYFFILMQIFSRSLPGIILQKRPVFSIFTRLTRVFSCHRFTKFLQILSCRNAGFMV